MQTMIEQPTTKPTTINQSRARQIADTYLVETFGQYFSANHGVFTQSVWRFLIQCQMPTMPRLVVVGRLDINAQSGEPVPLTASDIVLIQQRRTLWAADLDGEVPVDASGYILPYLAKRNVKAYLGRHVSIFAQPADEPQWIAEEPPYWRVSVLFRQNNAALPLSLGYIDVDAITGTVVPLTALQLQAMQRRVQNASVDSPSSTRTAG